MKKIVLLTLPLIAVFCSFQTHQKRTPVVIEGVVMSNSDGKPVSQAHVYIVHGEEEALTDRKGNFRIESWQKLPAKLTVAYKNKKVLTATISTAAEKQTFWIKTN